MVAAADKMHTRLFFERALRGAAPNLPGATCSSGKYPAGTWFPRGTDRPGREFARNLCLGCPVLRECREWATTSCTIPVGIVAGLTARQRRELRDQQRKAVPA